MTSPVSLPRLRWKCRRGMLELDRLLEGFVAREFASLDADQKAALAELLECEDDMLWDWLTGRAAPESKGIAAIVDKIRNQH